MNGSGRARLRRAPLPAWQRRLWLAFAYGLLLPVSKVLTLLGQWPRLVGVAMNRTLGRFADYVPGPHDVLVCSYFKSGTNWAMQIAVQIAHRGRAEFDHIHDLVAWADLPEQQDFAAPLGDLEPARRAPTGLRVIKTHLPLGAVPYSPAARYVCVVRDPKDVLVSSYHFTRAVVLGPLMPTVERWLELFLSPDAPLGSWARFADSYWRARHRDNVLFLTYELMKADLPGAVDAIARLMGVALTPEERAAVVRQASLEHMKRIGHKFDAVGVGAPWARGEGAMVRRGERGAAGELLSAEQQRRIDEHWKRELAALGSDFPYDAAFGRDEEPAGRAARGATMPPAGATASAGPELS